MDALSLDQFAVFAAVVEEGSFAAAARRMNRAQSAITYAIQKLEDQSGVELFDRSVYRPVLTEAGRALLPRARRVLVDLEEYRAHARRMTMGLEDELTIRFHPYGPRGLFSSALADFRKEFPSVRIDAAPTTRDAALEALRTGDCDLAVVHQLVSVGAEFEHRPCARFDVVVVASPDHPLAAIEGEIETGQMQDYLQLATYGILSDAEASFIHMQGLDAICVWRVMDVAILRELLIAGAGWGSMPRRLVESDIADGRLVVLRPQRFGNEEKTLIIPLVIARGANRAAGPAARWLFDRFARSAQG